MGEYGTGGAPPLTVEREPLSGTCPRCDSEELSTYPVLSEGGWFEVVKCQRCLHSLQRKPWCLLGPVKLTSTGLILD